MSFVLRLLAVAALALPVCGGASAAIDYHGKLVTIVIGYGVGGSYHQYAQMFSRHLGRFLPGEPTVVVQSMPGAGGVRMLNEAASRMKNDGTTLFLPPDTSIISQLLEPGAITYDVRRFHYIGTADQQNMFWVVRRSKAENLSDLRSREIFMGSSGKGSTGHIIPSIAMGLLDLRVKQIGGYQGSRDTILAMEAGEVDGSIQGLQVWTQTRPTWFEPNGFAAAIMQIGAMPDPDMPNVPLFGELVDSKDRPVVSLLDTIGLIGRSLAAPPDVPLEYIEVLREAFDRMVKDEAFVVEAKRTMMRLTPQSGVQLQASILNAMATIDSSSIDKARRLVQ